MKKRRGGLTAAVVLVLLSGCATSGQPSVAANSPLASKAASPSAAASAAPSGPRTYTTQQFLVGMSVTVSDNDWIVNYDGEIEFKLVLADHPGAAVFFWLDPLAYDGDHVVGHPGTPAEVLSYLKSNPNLVISGETTRTIGDGIDALSFDLDLSASAPKEDPSCPTTCYSYFFLNDSQGGSSFGTGLGEPVRMYLASIGSGSTSHVFAIALDNQDPPDTAGWTELTAKADSVLATVRLPDPLPPSS
jgi:hypothetical protein